jgi:acetolactate synthase small subunit
MRWMYLVVTENEPRTEARVFQIVDNQQVPILAFSAYRLEEELFMTLTVEADVSKAERIESLLRKLQAILRVDAFPELDGLVRTLALIKVRCDLFTRDPLLQMLGAAKWRIVQFHPLWIGIEVVGTEQEVAEFCVFSQSYGPVETMSIVSVPMRARAMAQSQNEDPPTSEVQMPPVSSPHAG